MRLYNGDCLEIMKEIPNGQIDMILCDLPYGVTDCKWDSIIPFNLLWQEYERVIKDNGVIILFSIQPFTTKLIHSNLNLFRYCWYWKKHNSTGALFSKQQPRRCIEDVCVFYKKKPIYNPQGLIKLDKPVIHKPVTSEMYGGKKKNGSIQQYKNYPNHLLEFKGITKDRVHPTQKPVELLEYLIKTYTNENDLVLDSCMGSGSTGIACVNTNRNFIGIELNNDYYEIAEKRINQQINESANR